ncbi:hypothetical protein F5X68DRAFT_272596 [Plectosphaerella plurivora]|uniref:Zn(2)-C6 fungal-type domain-containing protein n=1 Tax=Plectosphaerella plurivora TaxID=936078 RepID=A0A9P9AFB5_9PEZI|nr:hypothetical protein F5X68DRAFT_272596 [Plectosphaerella plurivora]
MSPSLSVSPGNDTATPRRELAARACDACRARRRKCVFDSNSPDASAQCSGCSRLGIHCSFEIPTRPRGPKRKRDQPSASPLPQVAFQPDNSGCGGESIVAQSSPIPAPAHHADTHLSVFTSQVVPQENHRHAYPTDELCSRPLILTILADYTDRIYPVVPVVHIPTFRRNLNTTRDATDVDFRSLIVAIVGLTVALLPSRFAAYMAMDPDAAARFPARVPMVSYCAQMCQRLRSLQYWDEVSHCKWAISYTTAITFFHVGQKNYSRILEAEALQVARLLGLHDLSAYEGLNPIETQLRKKAFWLTFYIFTHGKVQPGRRSHVTYLDNYMLQDIDFGALEPLDLLDEHISETGPSSPPSTSSPDYQFTHVSGFIAASRIFHQVLLFSRSNDKCDCGRIRTREERLSKLQALLHELKYSLDWLPPHMKQWAVDDGSYGPAASSENPNLGVGFLRSVGGQDACCPRDHRPPEADIVRGQHEITRANVHVSHLWFQSFLLDKLDEVVQEADDTGVQDPRMQTLLEANWREREDVSRQLLHVVHSIPHAYLEPNGNNLNYKIRAVATSLLNCPFTLDAHMAQRATGYVREFIKVLSYLDHSEVVNTDSLETWVDRDRVGALT